MGELCHHDVCSMKSRRGFWSKGSNNLAYIFKKFSFIIGTESEMYLSKFKTDMDKM